MTGPKRILRLYRRADRKRPRRGCRAMNGTKTTRGCIYCEEAVKHMFKGAGVCENHLEQWMKAMGWAKDKRITTSLSLAQISPKGPTFKGERE